MSVELSLFNNIILIVFIINIYLDLHLDANKKSTDVWIEPFPVEHWFGILGERPHITSYTSIKYLLLNRLKGVGSSLAANPGFDKMSLSFFP
jgi:hypothetical protein